MKLKAVIFTFPPDYVAAILAARSMAKLGIEVHLAIDDKDPYFLCEEFPIIRTAFDRNQNLNGTECIQGQLATMLSIAGDADYVIKADSDILMYNLEWIEGRTEVAVGIFVREMNGMNGSCYALKAADLAQMYDRALTMRPDKACPEDRVTGYLAKSIGPVHWPVYGRDRTGFVAYNWEAPKTAEEYRSHSVVIFDRRDDKNSRKTMFARMKELA